jgi:hypothetical protein
MLRRTGGILTGFVSLLLVSVGIVIVESSPASAHVNGIAQGSDYAKVSKYHSSGYICDRERDGDITYVEFSWYDEYLGGTRRRQVRDTGGADGVCETFSMYTLPTDPAVAWKMCEERAGADACTKTELL